MNNNGLCVVETLCSLNIGLVLGVDPALCCSCIKVKKIVFGELLICVITKYMKTKFIPLHWVHLERVVFEYMDKIELTQSQLLSQAQLVAYPLV